MLVYSYDSKCEQFEKDRLYLVRENNSKNWLSDVRFAFGKTKQEAFENFKANALESLKAFENEVNAMKLEDIIEVNINGTFK